MFKIMIEIDKNFYDLICKGASLYSLDLSHERLKKGKSAVSISCERYLYDLVYKNIDDLANKNLFNEN